jgi:hypothetical protein
VISNSERFHKDIDRLLDKGQELQLAMIASAYTQREAKELFAKSGLGDKDYAKACLDARSFPACYQAWYSESLAMLRQLLPDRVADFRALYERPANRRDISFVNYVMADYLIGLQSTRGLDVVADTKSAIPKFQNQLSIVAAARARLRSSLFEMRQLVQADVFDSEIASARGLLKGGFVRAAGAVAGVVLEKHLRQVCGDRGIRIPKKNLGISDLNEALRGAGAIDVPEWRRITLLADYRNLCSHGKQKEPTLEQVEDLIDGTDRVLKTVG